MFQYKNEKDICIVNPEQNRGNELMLNKSNERL